MGEIDKYRGSNLPDPIRAGLGAVTVGASRRATPWVFAGAGVVAGGILMGHVGHDPVPMLIQHLPLIGQPLTHGLTAIGGGITGIEHIPGVAPLLLGGAGVAAYKGVGKPVQTRAKALVRRHGLE